MNLLAIVNDALERCQYATVATVTTSIPSTRMLRFANQWHRKVLSDAKYSRLRDAPITLASVASQASYGLPPSVAKIQRMWEATTNTRLGLGSLDWLRTDPQGSTTATGTPQYYIPQGVTAVTRQPAATGLWAASTSAADTTQTINIEGIRTGGYLHTPAPKTLNGLTRVAIGTTPLTDYIDVQKCWLSGVGAGDISLYDAAAAGNVLAVIPIGRVTAKYFTVFLWPVPSTAITYTIECQRAISEMTLGTDEPIWPEDFHPLLVSCLVYQELLIKKDPATAGIYFNNEVKPGMLGLLSYVVNLPDYVVVPDDGRDDGGSNLGPWYKAGRW